MKSSLMSATAPAFVVPEVEPFAKREAAVPRRSGGNAIATRPDTACVMTKAFAETNETGRMI